MPRSNYRPRLGLQKLETHLPGEGTNLDPTFNPFQGRLINEALLRRNALLAAGVGINSEMVVKHVNITNTNILWLNSLKIICFWI